MALPGQIQVQRILILVSNLNLLWILRPRSLVHSVKHIIGSRFLHGPFGATALRELRSKFDDMKDATLLAIYELVLGPDRWNKHREPGFHARHAASGDKCSYDRHKLSIEALRLDCRSTRRAACFAGYKFRAGRRLSRASPVIHGLPQI